MRLIVATAALLTVTSGSLHAAEARSPVQGMIEVTLHGQKVEGMPLAFTESRVHLLGRDGRLWSFDPNEATDFRQTSSVFRPASVSEIRAALLRELGEGFDVTGTTHYMVAHPAGQEDRWARRFEDLYRALVHFFSVRGFRLTEPPFPLIGIVCRNRGDFDRYAARQGGPVSPGVLGYYDLESNRIILYDLGGGKGGKADWRQTAATVIHEATHQTAFNTGIHNRWSPPPVWVAEGLATLFEAPGVYDSRSHTRRTDRINEGRLRDYRTLIAPNASGNLPEALTASDGLFATHPSAAYAEAWAIAFYLVETQPREFARYLALTASHAPFVKYTSQQRLADFAAVFGRDARLFDAKLRRFMAEVP
ncbi:MAG: DUF1570 domain-containing protein [Pirellulales bacterium]|nr:DUF1570 domain-containing protein [Pirellulales bacterium]